MDVDDDETVSNGVALPDGWALQPRANQPSAYSASSKYQSNSTSKQSAGTSDVRVTELQPRKCIHAEYRAVQIIRLLSKKPGSCS